MRVVLLGPPGCGKGTQAQKIRQAFKIPHLATGDMLRAAAARKSGYGMEAQAFMQAGKLVPDDIAIGIVEEAIDSPEAQRGFILDGFPRNVTQAVKLDEMLAKRGIRLDHAVEFAIDDAVLAQRITGRLIHPASGRTYHASFCPPLKSMTDDVTGEPLVRREDDNEETLKRRLLSFHEQTKPLEKYYASRGILSVIDADKQSASVWADLQALFKGEARAGGKKPQAYPSTASALSV